MQAAGAVSGKQLSGLLEGQRYSRTSWRRLHWKREVKDLERWVEECGGRILRTTDLSNTIAWSKLTLRRLLWQDVMMEYKRLEVECRRVRGWTVLEQRSE